MDEQNEIGMAETKKSGINPKVFLIGLPLFIIQLVVVYFVTANILLSKMQSKMHASGGGKTTEQAEEKSAEESQGGELGKYVYQVNDIIVNPAGTGGQRLMLTSMGIDLKSEEFLKEIESKDVLVKDVIISILSSKGVNELSSATYKDSLKSEITKALGKKLGGKKINSVYFSKYILQ